MSETLCPSRAELEMRVFRNNIIQNTGITPSHDPVV
jgi:hypothetical protein